MQKKMSKNKNIAIVLGMTETALGVIRSLGRNGIKVIGLDYRKDMAFWSRYAESFICPHPLGELNSFQQFLISLSKKYTYKPILYLTSDDFVLAVSRIRANLSPHFLFNIPSEDVVEGIINKKMQYEKAKEVGIPIPRTFYPRSNEELQKFQDDLKYPQFIKGCYSYIWKENFGSLKGFLVENREELNEKFKMIFEKKVPAMVQEVVQGPDTNHYKVSIYISQSTEPLLVFTLRKIRQLPTRFGVGSCVESIDYPELLEIGLRYFMGINYRGIGSAEFKLDEKDNILKLIELNPRLWQQNILSTVCGMNFPMVQYLDLTGERPQPVNGFKKNMKWLNIYMDFQSFWHYHREKKLTLLQWIKSLKGVKVLSDFALDDIKPFLHEFQYGLLLLKLPLYLLKKHD
jgi:predicted ATP-grasp superfamily ATP-dependent carboligase